MIPHKLLWLKCLWLKSLTCPILVTMLFYDLSVYLPSAATLLVIGFCSLVCLSLTADPFLLHNFNYIPWTDNYHVSTFSSNFSPEHQACLLIQTETSTVPTKRPPTSSHLYLSALPPFLSCRYKSLIMPFQVLPLTLYTGFWRHCSRNYSLLLRYHQFFFVYWL